MTIEEHLEEALKLVQQAGNYRSDPYYLLAGTHITEALSMIKKRHFKVKDSVEYLL